MSVVSESVPDPAEFDWDEQPAAIEAARDRAKASFVTQLVSLTTQVPPQEILRQTRAKSEAARARWIAMYLLHTGFSVPLNRVAAAFGRDRTTVSHACHCIEDLRGRGELSASLDALEACVRHAAAETAA